MIAMYVILVTLSGCGGSGGPSDRSHVNDKTMTQKQATERVEQIIRETVAALTIKPRLEMIESMSQPDSCVDPTDGGSPDRTVISHSYWLRGFSRTRNGDIGQQAKDYWESKGYKITNVNGISANEPNISGYTRPDEFLFSIETNVDGDVNIGATSPCIWPNGTPEPSSH